MNSNYNASSLTVKSFRGINKELTLDFKDITILYGVNGMGKSSFINSLEYLFSEKLDFLKKTTIKHDKSAIHKDSTKRDVNIELDFKNGEYINLKGNSSGFKEFLRNPYIKNASFILNR
ncbi:MAG: AAA family ATPase, partial [Methanobrevibacter sp.]|nr:AAA family ATPase [Methanobrevibacter sp.]